MDGQLAPLEAHGKHVRDRKSPGILDVHMVSVAQKSDLLLGKPDVSGFVSRRELILKP